MATLVSTFYACAENHCFCLRKGPCQLQTSLYHGCRNARLGVQAKVSGVCAVVLSDKDTRFACVLGTFTAVLYCKCLLARYSAIPSLKTELQCYTWTTVILNFSTVMLDLSTVLLDLSSVMLDLKHRYVRLNHCYFRLNCYLKMNHFYFRLEPLFF